MRQSVADLKQTVRDQQETIDELQVDKDCRYCKVQYAVSVIQRFGEMAMGSGKSSRKSGASASLTVRLDADSKAALTQAAELRKISLSDYVRTVTVPQAKREVAEASQNTIALSPDEQLSFWNALSQQPALTPAQRNLGAVMRGEA